MNSAEIPRATYHHGDLRTALVSAAEGLLASGATLSLRAVAKAAGVSHAAPYHHFANLDALLAAVATRGFHDLAADMEAAHPGDRWRPVHRARAHAFGARPGGAAGEPVAGEPANGQSRQCRWRMSWPHAVQRNAKVRSSFVFVIDPCASAI